MTVHSAPNFPPADPPAGARLELGVTAAALKVTLADMATATGISRTACCNLLSNQWPVKADQVLLRQQLLDLFAQRGASDEQLARLFHAHTGRRQAAKAPVPPRPATAPVAPTINPEEDNDMLLIKQVLSPQARRHFKLFTNPFDGEVATDAQMFNGDDVRYVREAAWQCSQTHGFVAIVGESGAGKTTIMADLEARIASASDPVVLIKPSVLGMAQKESQGSLVRSADILHAIVNTLDENGAMPQTMSARTARARKLLQESARMNNSHLVLIEEAHSLPDATLTHLKRLHEVREGRRPLLGILLLGQPELKTRLMDGLRKGSLREVAQRCEIVELLPLDNDLKPYLECRAAAAGRRLGELVSDDAVEALRARLTLKDRGTGRTVSMCYPLAVHNWLTKALNAAAELGVPLVTKDVVAAM